MSADLGTLPPSVGQRRTGTFVPFPTASKGNEPGIEPDMVTEEGGGSSTDLGPDPCENPVTKVIWNADARAAAAVAAFIARSLSEGSGGSISTREFGANLVKTQDNMVDLGPIGVGDLAVNGTIPEVTIPSGTATYLNWMGDIHNHPSGDGRPSAGEWNKFKSRVDAIITQHPERATEMAFVAIYIVVGSPPNHKIYAYKRSDDPDKLGEEVNPAGQPCYF